MGRADECAPQACPRAALMAVGAAFLWLCLKSAALAVQRAVQGGVAGMSGAVGLYGLYAVLMVAVAVGVTRATAHARAALVERLLAVAAAVCGAAGLALFSADGTAALAAGLALTAIFVGVFLTLWAVRFVALPIDAVPLAVVLSYLLAEVVRFAVSLAGADAVRPLYPLASLALLLACPLAERPSVAGERASLQSMSWGMVATCAGLIAVWSFAMGLIPQQSGGAMSHDDLTWSYGFSSIMLAALAAFFWRMRRTGKASRQQFLYPFTAIVVVYLFVITGMLALETGDNFTVFKRAFIAVSQCLEVFAITTVLFVAAERKLSPVAALALFVAFFGCGPWLIASELVEESGVFSGSTAGEWAALGLSFITVVILVVYLLRSATVAGAKAEPAREDSQLARCQKASAAHGLSAKEQEVALLLYRGLSAKRIAEELYISENTVRSHTSSIYRKLGVHSKQELIQLFDHYED